MVCSCSETRETLRDALRAFPLASVPDLPGSLRAWYMAHVWPLVEAEQEEANAVVDAALAAVPSVTPPDAVRDAAERYLRAAQLAGSYPGHEEHIEEEYLDILREKDDAEEALEVALAAAPSVTPLLEAEHRAYDLTIRAAIDAGLVDDEFLVKLDAALAAARGTTREEPGDE